MFPTSLIKLFIVAPLVGAWIEIKDDYRRYTEPLVAPLVGAWIEIQAVKDGYDIGSMSLLSWERGLKSFEIAMNLSGFCRSSRGSVD